jgi:hypothetical protein
MSDPVDGRLGGPQGQAGLDEEGRKYFCLPLIESLFLYHPAGYRSH